VIHQPFGSIPSLENEASELKPLKIGLKALKKETIVLEPSIFRGELAVSFRGGLSI